MAMMPEQDRTIAESGAEAAGLVEALAIIRRRWWIVLVCGAVCGLAALAYVEHLPKQYTATAKLQFANSSIPSQVAGVPQTQTVDPEGEKATNLQLVTTTPVAELVAKSLKLSESPQELLNEVSASNPNNDYIIDVSATSSNPVRAAALANAFAQQYTVYSQQQNEAQLVKGQELINRKLAQLPASDTTDRSNLHALYQKLQLLQAVQTANAHVVNTAAVPSSPSSPKTAESVLIAAILGLLIGVGVVFLINVLDRRVRSIDALEALYRLPALATVPKLPARPRTTMQREIALEPFRILHNALPIATGADSVSVVLVTSAVSTEGKTTIALGLARAAADSGLKVVLVEADLRRPSLSARLQLSGVGHGGLAAALLDGVDPETLLIRPPGASESLRLLPTGRIPTHPIDLLNAPDLPAVFSSLAKQADLVVIDSAPLLPVADTRTLLDRITVDLCLIVGRVGVTTKDQARRARTVLDQRIVPGVGLVVDDTTDVSGSHYYYGDGRSDEEAEVSPHRNGMALSRPRRHSAH